MQTVNRRQEVKVWRRNVQSAKRNTQLLTLNPSIVVTPAPEKLAKQSRSGAKIFFIETTVFQLIRSLFLGESS
jgi:hypothetical protein